ncbi:MAG: hypothetical protein GOU98_04775 [Candidatus Altiarchaeota archaeon]|nr:hypothetical protein [Candidatus Altiarchaeota archaeon]
MKSFEFLVVVGILVFIFAPLYTIAKNQNELLNEKLQEFNESIIERGMTSIVNNMKAYGEPFEYKNFGDFNPKNTKGLTYNPLTDTFTYTTYSRW